MLRKLRGNYRFGFEPWGLGLFLLIMLPNFIWFALPAPNDVLRKESVTPAWDAAASVFQMLTAFFLCLLKNKSAERIRFRDPLILAAAGCCACYYLSWVFYYRGIVNAGVILALCLFPCAALFAFGMARKNNVSMISTALFAVCHTVFGAVNFLLA